MLNALTKKTTDHSDRAAFSFSFFCDRCGKEWISPQEPQVLGGFTAIDQEETRQMVWAQEHREAFERANLEAHFHFNHCPVCGRWVCDECFGVGEPKNRAKCRDCNE